MRASVRRCIAIVLVVSSIVTFIVIIKHLDLSTTSGYRSFITVSFGFASSCLLLSSVWLIQNGNLYASWPSLSRIGAAHVPPPSRARGISQQSAETYEVYSVSFKSDKPPEYKDALKNSKPISWLYTVGDFSEQTGALPEEARSYHKQQDLNDTCDCGKADTCASNSNFRNTILSNTSVTQIAISMIRGFSHHAADLPNAINSSGETRENGRRVSFYQLDVEQLALSNSPPKYSYLQSAGLIIEEPTCGATGAKVENND